MVDTGGTLVKSADALYREGAKKVFAACTHPVLSGKAVEKIDNSQLERLLVTNTVPLKGSANDCKKIEVLSVAGLFGEAIRRIHEGSSVSSLFV
jgi:ribose-phosphate pyrophosphokinase